MPGYRFCAVLANISRGITMRPTVVPISVVGWLCAGIFVCVGNYGSEFGDILECFDLLNLASCESLSKGTVDGC